MSDSADVPTYAISLVRTHLENSMQKLQMALDHIDLPIEVGVIAVRAAVEDYGSIIVSSAHPMDASTRVAELARQVESVYRDEAGD